MLLTPVKDRGAVPLCAKCGVRMIHRETLTEKRRAGVELIVFRCFVCGDTVIKPDL
jgi:predicted RNA-binding Zn-ribbon protein involved in translation (DUF1610 family)